jgi:hypothetical protein
VLCELKSVLFVQQNFCIPARSEIATPLLTVDPRQLDFKLSKTSSLNTTGEARYVIAQICRHEVTWLVQSGIRKGFSAMENSTAGQSTSYLYLYLQKKFRIWVLPSKSYAYLTNIFPFGAAYNLRISWSQGIEIQKLPIRQAYRANILVTRIWILGLHKLFTVSELLTTLQGTIEADSEYN